jgi:cation transport regulator ChaC
MSSQLSCYSFAVETFVNSPCAMFRQIYLAVGPSGPNKEYLFKLEDALNKLGKVMDFSRIIEQY